MIKIKLFPPLCTPFVCLPDFLRTPVCTLRNTAAPVFTFCLSHLCFPSPLYDKNSLSVWFQDDF